MTAKKTRRRPTVAAFDLETVRVLKRLAKRLVRKVEDIERAMVKRRKLDREPGTEAERAAALEALGPRRRKTLAEEAATPHPLIDNEDEDQ